MLFELFKYLEEADIWGAGLWQFTTFRAGVAIIFSLFISLLMGGRIIKFLRKQQVGETIRDLGLDGQKEKEGTPTMGGVIIIMAIIIPCVLVADLSNIYIQLMLVATVWMGLIGFLDDYIKVFRKNKKGLSGKFKVIGQIGLGLLIGMVMMKSDKIVLRMDLEEAQASGYEIVKVLDKVPGADHQHAHVKTTITNVPFLKNHRLDYAYFTSFMGENAAKFGWGLFILAVIFIVTSISNAANLTDGIDGLATGVSSIQ